jgi:hypothetical protein
MRKKDKNTIYAEKLLNAMDLEALDSHALENAKTRVFNQLSQSINILEKNKMENVYTPQKSKFQTFLSKNWKVLSVASTVGVLALTTFSIGAFVILNNQAKKETLATNQVANNPKLELGELKTLAAARFKTLNNGVSYEDAKAVTETPKATQQLDSRNQPLSTSQSTAIGAGSAASPVNLVNQGKAKEILEKNKNIGNTAMYKEEQIVIDSSNESRFLPGSFASFYVPYNHPKINYSKPVTVKTWYNPEFYKTVLEQDNNLIALMLSTSNSNFMYVGGKYAVEEKYPEAQYFGGYMEANKDPEISFLEYLLQDGNGLKQIETVNENGKTLTVYEQQYDQQYIGKAALVNGGLDISQFSTKYYVDLNNVNPDGVKQIKLYRTETYLNNKIVQSVKNIDSKTVDNIETVKNHNELGNIEIKSIQSPVFKDIAQTTVVDFIKKQPIYYIENAGNIESVNLVSEDSNQSDYAKLTMTKDFDPTFTDIDHKGQEETFVGGYYQGMYSYSLFAKNPIPESSDYMTVTQKPLTLYLDNKPITGIKAEITYKAENPTNTKDGQTAPGNIENPNETNIYFENNGVWYFLSGSGFQPNSEIRLISLSSEKAAIMDKENKERQESLPETEDIKLDQLSQEMKLLPGDLTKDLKLKARSAVKAKKTPDQSTCAKYYLVGKNTMIDCLIEKYDGVKISFDATEPNGTCTKVSAVDPTQCMVYNAMKGDRYVDYYILKTNKPTVEKHLNEIDLPILQGQSTKEESYSLKEIDGKTILILGNISKEDQTNILNKVSLNNGFEDLKKQIADTTPVTIMTATPSSITR